MNLEIFQRLKERCAQWYAGTGKYPASYEAEELQKLITIAEKALPLFKCIGISDASGEAYVYIRDQDAALTALNEWWAALDPVCFLHIKERE